jgi:PTH1 family peptidyl-tRNA hydrolase
VIILGLGNPGPQYGETRHNVGFLFLDYVRDRYLKTDEKQERDYSYFTGRIKGEALLFIKPQTFMNLSGRVIKSLKKGAVEPSDILVIYDDVALPFGKIRIRTSGSSGGHNGIQSIINALGGQENFVRIRIGVGGNRGDEQPLHDYVLEKFSNEEWGHLGEIFDLAWSALMTIMTQDVGAAMSRFNGKIIETESP